MKLNAWRVAAYASLGAPTKALTLLLTLYVPALYAAEPGLGLAAVGLIFMGVRIFDIIVDPAFGAIADRTETRFGRRRLWIAAGIPLLAVSVWFVVHPAAPVSAPALIAWLGLLYLAWTVITISHNAWAPELTQDEAAVRRLIGWREWAGILGMLAIMVGPAIEEHYGVALAGRMMTMGLCIAGAIVVFGLAALTLVPELAERHTRPKFCHQFGYIFVASAGLRRVLAADLLAGCGYGSASALMLFVAKSWLGVGNMFGTIMLVYFLAMLAAVPAWMAVASRIGARQTFQIALGLAAIAQLAVLALPVGSPLAACLLWLIQGALTGAYQFSLNTVMAQTVAADSQADAQTRSGIYFAFLATTNKIGYAVAIGMAYPLLQLLKFGAATSHGTAFSAVLLYAVLPAACFAAAAAAIRREAGHLPFGEPSST